jgi:hypothetical protein
MKFQVLLLAVLFCLAAQAAGKPGQGAPTDKSAARAEQSLTGCIDEQDGQYVLLDDRMLKIVSLQSAGSDQEVFAKHLGRKVKVTGTESSARTGTFKVTGIERLPGICGEAK